MTNFIFPILMTLFVTVIILCKEFKVTIKGMSKKQKNIWFLIEPGIYSIFALSWIELIDINWWAQILFSVVIGDVLFFSITAFFMEPKQESSKSYTREELIDSWVMIRKPLDETHYLGDIIGNDGINTDIIVMSEEKLEKDDMSIIKEISGSNIIVKKINKE